MNILSYIDPLRIPLHFSKQIPCTACNYFFSKVGEQNSIYGPNCALYSVRWVGVYRIS